jgi:hypothetical protein
MFVSIYIIFLCSANQRKTLIASFLFIFAIQSWLALGRLIVEENRSLFYCPELIFIMSTLDFLFAHTKIAENCNRTFCVFKTNRLMLNYCSTFC